MSILKKALQDQRYTVVIISMMVAIMACYGVPSPVKPGR